LEIHGRRRDTAERSRPEAWLATEWEPAGRPLDGPALRREEPTAGTLSSAGHEERPLQVSWRAEHRPANARRVGAQPTRALETRELLSGNQGHPASESPPMAGAVGAALVSGLPTAKSRLDQWTRRLVGFGVHGGAVTAADVCRMFNSAICGQGVPRHVSTDHDPVFEAHRWRANLRILEIDEIKTVPHVPLSHPFVERLIGTMRREFLDHVLFWNARDLERKLAEFQSYYNAARSHAALDGRTPLTFADNRREALADPRKVRWVSYCRGLVQLPIAA